MRRFCVQEIVCHYVDIDEKELRGMSDEEACEYAEDKYFENGATFDDPETYYNTDEWEE